MKKKQIIFFVISLFICSSIIMISCNKDHSASNSATTQSVSMYLTDGPGLYDSVSLNVTGLEVLVDTSTNTRKHDGCDWGRIGDHGARPDSSLVWENLDISAGIYNILNLRNGIDTLLAQSTIPMGTIRLIRINLGSNNTVTKSGITYPLQIPAGAPSYIIVQLKGGEWDNFASNHYRLWLDFDVQRSIIQLNSTTFYLRPIVNFFILKNTGSISGTILPNDSKAVITFYSSSDTAYAIPGRQGQFMVRGLSDGNYSALIHSFNGYQDSTIKNIVISNAAKVNEGSITLHK